MPGIGPKTQPVFDPLRTFAILAAAAFMAACGGSEESVSETAGLASAMTESREVAKASASAASAQSRVIKVSQRFEYSSINPLSPIMPQIVESVTGEFDARQLPINIVDCGTIVGEEASQGRVLFGMVLGIREQDRGVAEQLGFREVGTGQGQNAFEVVTTGACSGSLPTVTTEQRIHGFAQKMYPALFAVEPGSSIVFGTFERYRYGYYLRNEVYLGLSGDDVYVHNGREWNFLYVGKVRDYIPYIDGIPGTQPLSTGGQ